MIWCIWGILSRKIQSRWSHLEKLNLEIWSHLQRSHFSEFYNQIERNCFKIVHRKYISEESERERKGERSVWRERQWKVFDFFFFRGFLRVGIWNEFVIATQESKHCIFLFFIFSLCEELNFFWETFNRKRIRTLFLINHRTKSHSTEKIQLFSVLNWMCQ